jgi:hypothetical protein
MTEPDPALSPLGELLEHARQAFPLSKREAARRARISEARWRQIVTGWQNPGDRRTPAKPRSVTVVAAARAVEVDPAEALRAAGLPPLTAAPAGPTQDDALRRILTADIDVDKKEIIIKRLLDEQRKTDQHLRDLVDRLITEFGRG